ncbi:hypothetical protein LCGC14_0627910 [marine sediment metagenome]|uniref:Nuclease associated modular domain-containing protein n=1 Tax=marine sediment metagenome TaxID=412755 RepID=A0A0F9TPB2_9ZZZZ
MGNYIIAGWNKGKHLSEQHKARIGAGNKGKKRTKEQIAKMSLISKGKPVSQQTRDKISNALKGKLVSNKTRLKLSIALTGLIRSEQTRTNISKARKGRPSSKEANAKRSASLIGRIISLEHRAKISAGWQHFRQTPEYDSYICSLRERTLGNTPTAATLLKLKVSHTGLTQSEETKTKRRQLWAEPNFKARVIKAMRLGLLIKPNKPETTLLSILRGINKQWTFVGDGQLIIAGKNPDFWDGGHKLIELFGDYWHRDDNPQKRIELFKKYNYDTLVIWEHELKSPNNVLAKLHQFC